MFLRVITLKTKAPLDEALTKRRARYFPIQKAVGFLIPDKHGIGEVLVRDLIVIPMSAP